jgi:hypothetical protein
MDRRRFLLLGLPSLYLCSSLRLNAQSASNAIPPPTASSRMDLSAYAKANNKEGFMTLDDDKAPAEIASMLGADLTRSKQYSQGWFLLSKDGMVTSKDYREGVILKGFGVTLGMVPIDDECKPLGDAKPIKMADIFDLNKIAKALKTSFAGAPNQRYRAITFWVTDVGKGDVQSDNTPTDREWDKLLHDGYKAPPISILTHIQMLEPHIFALVYEFEQSSDLKTIQFNPHGQDVDKHLKGSNIWNQLGLS